MRRLQLALWLAGIVLFIAAAGASAAPFAYITNEGNPYVSNDVSILDIVTNTVVATVPAVGRYPEGVAVTPDGSHVYVGTEYDNSVTVIATATNTVVAKVAVGLNPVGVAVTPDGARVYVANYSENTVSVIATATNTVVATVPVGIHPQGVALTPDGTRVYVANNGSNTLSVIATATNLVVATVNVGTGPVAFGKFIGP